MIPINKRVSKKNWLYISFPLNAHIGVGRPFCACWRKNKGVTDGEAWPGACVSVLNLL